MDTEEEGASYEGVMKSGKKTLMDNDVMAYIRSAKVPTRVALS